MSLFVPVSRYGVKYVLGFFGDDGGKREAAVTDLGGC
jgi:hypothetical protein